MPPTSILTCISCSQFTSLTVTTFWLTDETDNAYKLSILTNERYTRGYRLKTVM